MRSLSFLVWLSVPMSIWAQEARVAVRVSDFDTGRPITNATVSADFNNSMAPGSGWGGGRPNREVGTTDTKGVCVLTGQGNGGSVGIAASKDGYYASSGYRVKFTNVVGFVDRRWQPWDSTIEVPLKRIGNPIAMYAKRMLNEMIPGAGRPIGFDMKSGDWVVPDGEGQHADILFTFNREPDGEIQTRYGPAKTFDYSLAVSFPNPKDGILAADLQEDAGSVLKMPRNAPLTGYEERLERRVHRGRDLKLHSNTQDGIGYFLRVRTVTDDDGEIISALYGKIHGEFLFDRRGRLTFAFYLNPTPNDRNVEFDREKNLFGDVPSSERVREP